MNSTSSSPAQPILEGPISGAPAERKATAAPVTYEKDSGPILPSVVQAIEYPEITDFNTFADLASAVTRVTFELAGQKRSIRIRGLNSVESAELDKLTDAVVAPIDKKTGAPNTDDPAYNAALEKASLLKRVATFDLALLSFKIPGETRDEKVKNMCKMLPFGAHQEIYSRILQLTRSPITQAVFS